MEYVLFALRILMALALLGFLGVVFYLLLDENRIVARTATTFAPMPATMTLLSTTQQPMRVFKIERNAWIGRDPNSLIYVDDAQMSARHAQLVWDEADGNWFVEDNASRNGTYVNETRVMRCPLRPQDALRVGNAQLLFELAQPDRAPSRAASNPSSTLA